MISLIFPMISGFGHSEVVMKFTQKWMVYKGKSIKGSMEWKHLHIWQAAVQCCGLR